MLGIPLALLTDSYKTAHLFLYPPALKMVAYGEFRSPFKKDTLDTRIVYFGIRYIIEEYIAKRYTVEDVEMASVFFQTHNSGGSTYPFPKYPQISYRQRSILKICKGERWLLPCRDQGSPRGICDLSTHAVFSDHCRERILQTCHVNMHRPYRSYLETILTMIWYPSTVATLSRRCHTIIKEAYCRSVDDSAMWSLDRYFLG